MAKKKLKKTQKTFTKTFTHEGENISIEITTDFIDLEDPEWNNITINFGNMEDTIIIRFLEKDGFSCPLSSNLIEFNILGTWCFPFLEMMKFTTKVLAKEISKYNKLRKQT